MLRDRVQPPLALQDPDELAVAVSPAFVEPPGHGGGHVLDLRGRGRHRRSGLLHGVAVVTGPASGDDGQMTGDAPTHLELSLVPRSDTDKPSYWWSALRYMQAVRTMSLSQ